MTTTVSPQGKEEKAKVDQGLFLQLPYILIDTLSMSDSASLGFIRLCRQCLQKDKTIKYSGSYRQLAVCIQQSRMTCYRSVEQWVKAGLVKKTETSDDFILTGDLSSLWSKNSDHCKAHQRPKMGQSISTSASQNGTKPEDSKPQQRPTLTSTASQNNLSSVPDLNENERKTEDIYTSVDTSVDTFFGKQEQGSYSQQDTQPDEEKKEETHPFSLPAFYVALPDSWLQETSIQPEQALQAPSEVVTQASLVPEPPKPEKKYNIPDLRTGLQDRSNLPLSKADQKRIDEQAARAKEQQEKKRTAEIWEVFDHLFGSHVDRYGYNKSHVLSLARNTLATDEIITTAFNAVANSQAVKNNPAKLTITEIANVVPSYIRSEQIKVVANQNKRKSIDEQIAESEREAEKYSPKARARREAEERMVATHG